MTRENWIKKTNLYLNYFIIAYAFFIPLSRSGISIAIGGVIIFWILEGNWSAKIEIFRTDRLLQSIFFFLFFILLSLLWTSHYSNVSGNMKNYFNFLIVPAILTSFQKENVKKAFYAFGAGVVILLLLSILNYFNFIHLAKTGRPTNLFMHHLDFSMLLAWAVILAGVILFYSITNIKKNRYSGYLIFFWGILTFTGIYWLFFQTGRSGQFAFIITLPFICLKIFKKKYLIYYLIGALAVSALFFTQYKLDPKFKHRLVSMVDNIQRANINQYNSPVGIRILTDKLAFDFLKKSPVAGFGIGDNLEDFKTYVNTERKDIYIPDAMHSSILKNHFHNQYIQILTETGIIGLFLFFLILYFFYKRTMPGSPSLLALSLIVLFMAGFMAEPFLRNQITSSFFTLFIGLIYIMDESYLSLISKESGAVV